MAHKLPPAGHPVRELFDVRDLVAIGTRERTPMTLRDAIWDARRVFASSPAVRSVAYIVIESDDRLSLVSIGPKGGHTRRWTFGWGFDGSRSRPAPMARGRA